MLCVCISVWFCFGLFLYCMHVYCEYVCYLLSIYHPIHVDSCISITLYAVCRYAIYSYVFSLLDVHSMYVHYLYPCIYNSLSCIVVCLVLYGFTRYVCALICNCRSENSSNFAFLGVVLVLLYQVLLRLITTNLYRDDLAWDFSESKNANVFNWLAMPALVDFQNAIYAKKLTLTRMPLRAALLFVCWG